MKCARCKKFTITYSRILWRKGPRGFRRYPICRSCENIIESEQKPPARKLVEKPRKE